MKSLLIAAVLAFQGICECPASERGLPHIEETVDEIIYMQTVGCDHIRIVFIRDNKVLATRLQVEDMIRSHRGEMFCLEWEDYWTAERAVWTKKITHMTVENDPTQEGQDCLWWQMQRVMTDLKQP